MIGSNADAGEAAWEQACQTAAVAAAAVVHKMIEMIDIVLVR